MTTQSFEYNDYETDNNNNNNNDILAIIIKRILQYDTNNSSSNNNNNSVPERDDAYEFVAFLLWYIFLVLCCVVPTCCAYRRRRMVEHRLALQQASMNRFTSSSQNQHGNLFILSNLHNTSNRRNSERIQQERTRLLTDELKGTTMTIKEENIESRASDSKLKTIEESKVMKAEDTIISSMEAGVTDNTDRDNCNDDSAAAAAAAKPADTATIEQVVVTDGNDNNDGGDGETNKTEINQTLDHVIDESIFAEDSGLVRLPNDGVNANGRTVPGVCAICLCQYEDGEKVSWSTQTNCKHAFHTDCIIPWLAKKDEPKCPVCRQEFCTQPIIEDDNNELFATSEDDYDNSFLESFTQALAFSQFYRSAMEQQQQNNNNTINDFETRSLELTNAALRSRYYAAALAENERRQLGLILTTSSNNNTITLQNSNNNNNNNNNTHSNVQRQSSSSSSSSSEGISHQEPANTTIVRDEEQGIVSSINNYNAADRNNDNTNIEIIATATESRDISTGENNNHNTNDSSSS